MTDNEIIKALETCNSPHSDYRCVSCPLYDTESNCKTALTVVALDLIYRQRAKIEDLEYKITRIRRYVDKWLTDTELEQALVDRAIAMREETLQSVEKPEVENKLSQSIDVNKLKLEVISEVIEKIKEKARMPLGTLYGEMVYVTDIDNIKKEMITRMEGGLLDNE